MHLMLLVQDSLLFHEVSKLGLTERKTSTGRMKKALPFPPMGTLSPLEIRAPGKGRLTLQGMTTAARCLLPRNEVKRKRITISGRGGKPKPAFSVAFSSAFCEGIWAGKASRSCRIHADPKRRFQKFQSTR